MEWNENEKRTKRKKKEEEEEQQKAGMLVPCVTCICRFRFSQDCFVHTFFFYYYGMLASISKQGDCFLQKRKIV